MGQTYKQRQIDAAMNRLRAAVKQTASKETDYDVMQFSDDARAAGASHQDVNDLLREYDRKRR